MSLIDESGIGFSVRHSSEYTHLNKSDEPATEAYVDVNTSYIVIEAGDDDSSASMILDYEAAKRINQRLTEALEE